MSAAFLKDIEDRMKAERKQRGQGQIGERLVLGLDARDGLGDPGYQGTTRHRDDDCVHLWPVLHYLEADRPLPGDDVWVVVRMDEHAVTFGRERLRCGKRLTDVAADLAVGSEGDIAARVHIDRVHAPPDLGAPRRPSPRAVRLPSPRPAA